jgi:hypothetical protein
VALSYGGVGKFCGESVSGRKFGFDVRYVIFWTIAKEVDFTVR